MFNLLVAAEEIDNDEVFRLAIVDDPGEISRNLDMARPPMEPLKKVPDDLRIRDFLGTQNRISLLRRGERIDTQLESSTEVLSIDFGIVVENTKGTMALYPDCQVPLDLLLTTDPRVVEKLLKTASEIIAL